MNDSNKDTTFDAVDRAAASLREKPIPAGPSEQLMADTVSLVTNQASAILSSELRLKQRRNRLMKRIGIGTAAAAVVISLSVAYLGGGSSAYANFQKVLDNAEKAASVKMVVAVENNGKLDYTQTFYRQGNLVRAERVEERGKVEKHVLVYDIKARKGLALRPQAHLASHLTMDEEEVKYCTGMLGSFSEMKAYLGQGNEKAVKKLPDEKIEDRNTSVYEVERKQKVINAVETKDKKWEWTEGSIPVIYKIWIDPKTELPIRIRALHESSGTESMQFSDWNKKFDETLFEMKVPEGYKVIEPPKPTDQKPSDDGSDLAFVNFVHKAIENAEKATSLKYTVTLASTANDFRLTGTGILQGDHLRYDQLIVSDPVGTQLVIVDLRAKRQIAISDRTKTATFSSLDQKAYQNNRDMLVNFAELKKNLGNRKEDTVKYLGQERIGERMADVYEIQWPAREGEKEPTITKMWFDPETKLPIRKKSNMIGALEATIDFEEWNKKYDDSLFELKAPEGYTVRDLSK